MPLLRGLVEFGVTMPKVYKTLDILHGHDITSPAVVQLEGVVEVKTRIRFYDSVLYKDFKVNRVTHLLALASASADHESREKWLQARAGLFFLLALCFSGSSTSVKIEKSPTELYPGGGR